MRLPRTRITHRFRTFNHAHFMAVLLLYPVNVRDDPDFYEDSTARR